MFLQNGSGGGGGISGSRVFVLDINSNHDIQQYQQSQHQSAQQSSAQQGSSSSLSTTRLSETMIHRRIIEMYKYRDDFDEIDLNIQTCKTLSSSTRVDLYNALQHMKDKASKKLRRLSTDIDYIDPTVHEFLLIMCLLFNEIEIKSAPIEQTNISVGLSMSLRHALTTNMKCLRSLYLCCNFTDETCSILSEGLMGCTTLEYLRLQILSSTSTSNTNRNSIRNTSGYLLHKILQSLIGKSKLKELQLDDVTNAGAMMESLCNLLGHSQCELEILNLICDWDDTMMKEESPAAATTTTTTPTQQQQRQQQFFDSMTFCDSLINIRCNSIKRLLFHGINFENDSLRVVQAFPNIEILSISAEQMPKLAFLDPPPRSLSSSVSSSVSSLSSLQKQQQQQLKLLLPRKLKKCYFPCTHIDIEEGRRLIQTLPQIVDVPDIRGDFFVEYYLDIKMNGDGGPTITSVETLCNPSLWPIIMERASSLLLSEYNQRRIKMDHVNQSNSSSRNVSNFLFGTRGGGLGDRQEQQQDNQSNNNLYVQYRNNIVYYPTRNGSSDEPNNYDGIVVNRMYSLLQDYCKVQKIQIDKDVEKEKEMMLRQQQEQEQLVDNDHNDDEADKVDDDGDADELSQDIANYDHDDIGMPPFLEEDVAYQGDY